MPWYPCVGAGDVAGEYDKRVGPLYYRVDVGGVHAIVLDSEERGDGLGEGQLEWLRGDLNKVFVAGANGGGVKWVVVLVHRPLWRLEGKGNWGRVQRMLVEFNRRPIVSVEGGDAVKNGPRVVGVWAGEARAYSQEPVREGIRYTVVGATAARIDQDAAVAVRHFSVVKFDEEGVHPALVLLGGGDGAGAIVGEDFVTARERGVMDAIAGLSNEALGVEGAVDFSGRGGDAAGDGGDGGVVYACGESVGGAAGCAGAFGERAEFGDGDGAGECESVCGAFGCAVGDGRAAPDTASGAGGEGAVADGIDVEWEGRGCSAGRRWSLWCGGRMRGGRCGRLC